MPNNIEGDNQDTLAIPTISETSIRTTLRRVGSRFGAVLSGEMIQSLFHFVLNIVLVRELSAYQYGLFAIVFTTGAVCVTYIRNLVAVPAAIQLACSLGRPAARGYEVMFGSGAAVASTLMGLAVSLTLLPVIGSGALAGGTFVGLYTFRSYLRINLIARGRVREAGFSDLIYAGCGIAIIGLGLRGEDAALLDLAFLAIACAHALGIAVVYGMLRERLRFSLNIRIRSRYRAIWRTLAWSLASVTGFTLHAQGITLLFAFLAGPAAYAPIAATMVLYAPLRIAATALTNMLLPNISNLLANGQLRKARRIVERSFAVNGAACIVYGVLMLIALPAIGEVLFEGRFDSEPMGWIGVGVWGIVTLAQLYAIPLAFLEASAAFRSITEIVVASAMLGFVLMIPALLLLPPAYALLGFVASEGLALLCLVQAYRRRASISAEGQAYGEHPQPHLRGRLLRKR